MVVGYKEKDRILHLPFAVDWIEVELEVGLEIQKFSIFA